MERRRSRGLGASLQPCEVVNLGEIKKYLGGFERKMKEER
jgi:hypothetical protein